MTRQNIFKRDGGRCQYCGCGTQKKLTLDHVIPRSKGGKSTWTNLVTACQKCNTMKGDSLLENINMVLSRQPIRPSYISFLKMINHEIIGEYWNEYLNPQKITTK